MRLHFDWREPYLIINFLSLRFKIDLIVSYLLFFKIIIAVICFVYSFNLKKFHEVTFELTKN